MTEGHHNIRSVPELRRCPRCTRVLPLTAEYWHRNHNNPAGFAGWCKECRSNYVRARRGRQKGQPNWDSKKRRWTPEEEQLLREEYPNKPTVEVAATLRRSESAVRRRAHDLGLFKIRPRTTRPDVWLNAGEIAQAYRLGESQSALAREYTVGMRTIRDILTSEGCSIRGTGYSVLRRRVRIGDELYVQCTKCKKWKPRTREFFRNDDHSPDGLSAQCSECKREVDRCYLAAHPEIVEKSRRQTREYHRRMSRGLWAARWRVASEILLTVEEDDDG